jgi:hypothetical protein
MTSKRNNQETLIDVEGYKVTEMTLRQMRKIRSDNIDPEEMQYVIASSCVVKPDGSTITSDELQDLPVRLGTRILQAVAQLNVGDSGND